MNLNLNLNLNPKRTGWLSHVCCLSMVFVCLLSTGRAQGQGLVVWDAGGDGLTWSDPLNWFPDGLPASNDTVTIGSGEDQLRIGDLGTGTLLITDSGYVIAGESRVGDQPDSIGIATVEDAGSRWDSLSQLRVGISGNGTLNINAGGIVTSTNETIVGRHPLGVGLIAVDGPGALLEVGGYLMPGWRGDGSVEVTNGGTIDSGTGWITWGADGKGSVRVTGIDSLWSSRSFVIVGAHGYGTLTIEDGGEVTNSFGIVGDLADGSGAARITGPGAKWTNSSFLVVGNFGEGEMTVEQGGEVTSTAGIIGAFDGGPGTVTVTGTGSTWDMTNHLTVGGNIFTTDPGATAVLNVQQGGRVQTGLSVNVFEKGTVNIDAESSINSGEGEAVAGGLRIGTGAELTGAGIINAPVFNDGGTIAPGRSIGVLTVNGGLIQTTASTLAVELAGNDNTDLQQPQFDQLVLTGVVSLGGSLEVSLIDGYIPAIGEQIPIITTRSGGISGTFANVSVGVDSTVITGVEVSVLYSFQAVTVQITAAKLIGDLNGDGIVGIGDLNIVLSNWNQNVESDSWLFGDPSGDGFVGLEDLNVVLGAWNATLPPQQGGTVAVPEPVSWAIWGSGVVLVSCRRRRG